MIKSKTLSKLKISLLVVLTPAIGFAENGPLAKSTPIGKDGKRVCNPVDYEEDGSKPYKWVQPKNATPASLPAWKKRCVDLCLEKYYAGEEEQGKPCLSPRDYTGTGKIDAVITWFENQKRIEKEYGKECFAGPDDGHLNKIKQIDRSIDTCKEIKKSLERHLENLKKGQRFKDAKDSL